jgi:hypothetical protein
MPGNCRVLRLSARAAAFTARTDRSNGERNKEENLRTACG